MKTKQNQKDWANILFLTLAPFVGIIGTGIYVFYFGIRWWEPLLFLISYLVIGLSVTAGYHRYYSHRTYECNPTELWTEVQLRAREYQARRRSNAAALKQGFKAKLREYEACLVHARHEWRHVARMLGEMPEAV
jgi:hypothetical protein